MKLTNIFLVLIISIVVFGIVAVIYQGYRASMIKQGVNSSIEASGVNAVVAPENITEFEIREILRLQEVAYERNLTNRDVETLSKYVENDPELKEEFKELRWMLQHGYPNHASHSLESMLWLVKGIPYICPSDFLSHASPYLKFGEIERAKEAVKEGEEKLKIWEPKAKAIKKDYPDAFPNLDSLLVVMKREITEMDAGNYSDAQKDAEYLEQHGYC